MSESGLSAQACAYTDKQKKLIESLNSVISKEGIRLYIDKFAPALREGPKSLDVEHDEQGNLVGIGLSDGLSCEYFTNITCFVKDHIEALELIMHNGVSDIESLRTWGINVKDSQLIWDTMLIAHLIDSSKKDFGLKACAKRELGIEYPSYDDIVGKRGLKTPRITLDKQPIELVSKYNACDTLVTWKLYEHQKKAMGI